MKFFLDENFPKKAAPMLGAQGYEVFDIRGTRHEGKDDNWLFQEAQDHEAIFLTTDKDFFHTVPFLYESHYGVVVITLSQPDSIKILSKLRLALDFLREHDIRSKCLRITDTRIYASGD